MTTLWYDAKVINILNHSDRIKSFFLKIESDQIISFTPGQFLTFDLPIGDKRLARWRSYSIASIVSNDNEFELCIVNMEGGTGSTYLFEEVTIGTVLKCKAPDGGFVLKQPLDHDVVMICTGTGVAPFRSMIASIFAQNIIHKKVHLIFGTRFQADILYQAEFNELASKFPEFTYDIVLSKEPDWQGISGHVHQVYLDKYADSGPDIHFYLCGWSQMIDEAVENLLLKCRYDRSQISYELYG